MHQFSYTRTLLDQWGIPFNEIKTSDINGKKEADFIATFGSSLVLIEEKVKDDDADFLVQ